MRFRSIQLFNGKHTSGNTTKGAILISFALLLTMFPFSIMRYSIQSSPKISASSFNNTEMKPCNIFSGEWVPYSKEPYYNKELCHLIIDQQNCMKFGRPDRVFLKWRWKPDECELPLFDATHFLKLVKGKSMAFVGDSVGRNQMNSLLCLLNHFSLEAEAVNPNGFDLFFEPLEAVNQNNLSIFEALLHQIGFLALSLNREHLKQRELSFVFRLQGTIQNLNPYVGGSNGEGTVCCPMV